MSTTTVQPDDEVEASPTKQIRALVRDVIADHPDASVQDLADYVAKLTPEDMVFDFYRALLRDVVDEVLSQQRRNALDNHLKPRNRSPKLEQRRKWWTDLLASRVHVGSEVKLIGNCTVDDLQVCIDERRVTIARVEGQIENFSKLIALMVDNGVRTVADLPEQDKWETAA